MIIDVYNKILEQYKNLEKMSKEALSNNTIDIDAINDLKTKINNNLDKINNLNLDSKTLEELKKAYTTLLNNSNDNYNTLIYTFTNSYISANNSFNNLYITFNGSLNSEHIEDDLKVVGISLDNNNYISNA